MGPSEVNAIRAGGARSRYVGASPSGVTVGFSMARLALFALIYGCSRGSSPQDQSPAVQFDPAAERRLVALDGAGSLPYRGVIRSVGPFGMAYATESVPWVLDETPIDLIFDDAGYATVRLETPGQVEIPAPEGPATWTIYPTEWPEPDLHRVWPNPGGPPSQVVSLQEGLLAASGGRLMWSGPATPPHPVLSVDDPIEGLRARAIDVDGVTDAIAWTSSRVFLLRGRLSGGAGFGGIWEADGYEVAAADVADVTGDNLPDLVIAWRHPSETHWLDVWVSDGQFGFVETVPSPIHSPPVDVVVGDATARGLAQITVLHAEGEGWTRFIQGPGEGWVEIGPTAPATEPARGRQLVVAGDVNADSGDDVVMLSSNGPVLFDLLVDNDGCLFGLPNSQCEPTATSVGLSDIQSFTIQDGNGDQTDDLWSVNTSLELEGVFWLSSTQGQRQSTVVTLPNGGPFRMPEPGPISAADGDGDGAPELALGGPRWLWQWNGRAIANDPSRFWEPRSDATIVRAGVFERFQLVETDDDTLTTEMVMLTDENSDTRLKLVQYTPGGGRASQLGAIRLLADKVAPDDLRTCNNQALFALDGEAWRVDFRTVSALRLVDVVGNNVERVDCIETDAGPVGAYLDGDEVVLLGSADPPIATPGAHDLAVGGTVKSPLVEVCNTPDCHIVWWPFAPKAAAFIVSDATGTRVQDGAVLGPMSGELSVADVDGDGQLDLLGVNAADNLVFVVRSTGNAIGVPQIWHSARDLMGSGQARDGDADGVPDIWTVDQGGEVEFTHPRGTGN